MTAKGGGSMVYVASISGYRARMVYSVTKAALLMLAKTGATQLASRRPWKPMAVSTVSSALRRPSTTSSSRPQDAIGCAP
jgi:NAD(P)-dependent dehydrogenase (short-subunit alcohol dehydrogenase family)